MGMERPNPVPYTDYGPKTAESEPEFVVAPLFADLLADVPEPMRPVVWERALLYLPPQYADCITFLNSGKFTFIEARRAAGLNAGYGEDRIIGKFANTCVTLLDPDFDPIAWQQAHATGVMGRNVLNFLARTGDTVSAEERLPSLYERAGQWLAARPLDPMIKAIATLVYGLGGEPSQSLDAVARKFNMTNYRIRCLLESVFDANTDMAQARDESIEGQSLQVLQEMLGKDPRLLTIPRRSLWLLAGELAALYERNVTIVNGDRAAVHRRALATYRYICGKPLAAVAADLYPGDDTHTTQESQHRTMREIAAVASFVADINVSHDGNLAEAVITRIRHNLAALAEDRKRHGAAMGDLALAADDDRANHDRMPTWRDRAACANVDPDTFFFPEKGGSPRKAKAICNGCAVRSECLNAALKHPERFGVWGGTSEKDRRQLYSQAARQAIAAT